MGGVTYNSKMDSLSASATRITGYASFAVSPDRGEAAISITQLNVAIVLQAQTVCIRG